MLIVEKSNCNGKSLILMNEKDFNENVNNLNKSKIDYLNYTFKEIEKIKFIEVVKTYEYLATKYNIKSNEYKRFLLDNKIVTHFTNRQLIEI